MMKLFKVNTFFPIVLLCSILLSGCSTPKRYEKVSPPFLVEKSHISLGYSVQVGAFSGLQNAAQLARCLQTQGIWAFYFKDSSGLYKVRFGNFPSRSFALNRARSLQRRGIIQKFYIIKPEPLARILSTKRGKTKLRNRIVRTAYSFIGLPYRWGGESPGTGFDCSGFTMAVYRLNGLNLPRSSYQQWRYGIPVSEGHLRAGDLVFFGTSGHGKVSHVGIYVGKNRFIHAPSSGKRVKVDSLTASYFRKHFLGARKYI